MTAPAARKKPKKRTIVGTVLASLGVVVAALWGLDNWARQQVADYVTEKVEQVLNLDNGDPVTVEIAGVSVIAQVLTGTLDEVDVGVDDVTIGEFTGGVSLRAEGIPIDLQKPIDEVRLVDSEIQFESTFRLLGLGVEVGVAVEPFAENGEIGFTPTSVSLNGSTSSAESLKKTFGAAAESLLKTRSICVARWLPVALTVDEVAVRGDDLVITIGADKAILSDESLQTLGSCG